MGDKENHIVQKFRAGFKIDHSAVTIWDVRDDV